ncbi:MAG: tRNA 4-thiouridine(8) synthase ThiI [Oscillospiraceae bacterium]|jgi:thiamine biosynthesis protein ThiI|nr:tRNA 4-thiouridine(8) synthase ThiI [Oscillospiraceae bacterium]
MTFDEVLLLKVGETILKGQNRRSFEEQLLKNLRRALSPLGDWKITIAQSAVQALPCGEGADMDAAFARARRVFGFAGATRAARVPKEMPAILAGCAAYLRQELTFAHTFKCEAKRSDKTFPFRSPQLCEQAGESLLQEFPHLKVDVRQPDVTVYIEVREQHAFLHADQARGAGGLPVGSAGDAAVLISGGIDSPVAAWMMARRGLRLMAVHFASPPYTSERAEEKVHRLLSKVANYAGRIRLFVVPFTEYQEQIRERCPEELATLLMRRGMMRIAQTLALRENCGALITGESLGQVASQTMQALACTDSVTTLPVFRPLIGTDKDETVALARKIGTFELSILPYEDCCTVFTPRHPRTKPKPAALEAAEAKLELEPLMARALEHTVLHAIDGENR